MSLTGLTAAADTPTLSAKGNQAGSNERPVSFQLCDSGLELTSDQGVVFWCFHSEEISKSEGWNRGQI